MKAKKLCTKHYMQFRRAKVEGFVPVPWAVKTPSHEEAFWGQVDKEDDSSDCWIWQGRVRWKTKTGRGYGVAYDGIKTIPAHRYAYHLATGEQLLPSVPIHHKCSNTICVNPDHLQAITPQENTAEMLERQWYLKRIADLEAQLGACKCG